MARPRDYQQEYHRRIERGLGRGLSRRQARGHPGLHEPHVSVKTVQRHPIPEFEDVRLDMQKSGISLTAAAQKRGRSRERVVRYLHERELLEKRGRRYQINDQRQRDVVVYSRGRAHTIRVANYDQSRVTGEYMDAVGDFLKTNNIAHLQPFRGVVVTDITGKRFPLETDPNVLYAIHAQDQPSFDQVYQIVV